MRKTSLIVFSLIFLFQPNLFAEEPFKSTDMSKRIEIINSELKDLKIKIAESILEELENRTDFRTILSMKSIHSFTTEYSDFLSYERRIILMYPYLSESVKRYFSSMLRDNLREKRKEFNSFMEIFSKHESMIKDSNILLPFAQLRKSIENARDLTNQIIKYYSTEYERFRKDNR